MNKIKISYGILTHNETDSLVELLDFIIKHKDEEDEIVILDDYSDNEKTKEILDFYVSANDIVFEQRHLLKDYAGQKNYLTRMCSGDYILNIDADEMLSKFFITNIKLVLESNPTIDLYWIPRINTVDGITQEHINKWKWRISKLDGVTEIKSIKNISEDEYDLLRSNNLIIEERHFENGNSGFDGMRFNTPLINWPDVQGRLYRKRPNIKWEKPVHESIIGHREHTFLPIEKEWAIIHNKEIDRQEKQNEFYEGITE